MNTKRTFERKIVASLGPSRPSPIQFFPNLLFFSLLFFFHSNIRGKKSNPIRIRRAESNPPRAHAANSPQTSRRRRFPHRCVSPSIPPAAERRAAMSAEKPAPVRVLYCGVCGLPAEYCEFGPDFERCKPWLRANAPGVYPEELLASSSSAGGGDDKDVDKVGERLQGVRISSAAGSTSAGDASASKQEEVKRLPGGKVKKKDKQEVVIEKIVRNKRKCVTVVKGLELFGVKLSDASKKLGKKFATGASVVKGPTEKEQIDVQGDISYDIVEFITDTWPDVPESAIFFIEDGRKVAAA
ncbi:hypothetical protein E2562_000613 [Oryza meyeriana var. granulata]|uniref:Translation machinery-associated protein 22 n=1 Tax=Oryza meyeriana var. granulata TaxID=110450 RepID=A0A6G1DTX4_9ORYZ|nr:hypothetical protein E2562_000613 [Oryza meyeriana var. granulata]